MRAIARHAAVGRSRAGDGAVEQEADDGDDEGAHERGPETVDPEVQVQALGDAAGEQQTIDTLNGLYGQQTAQVERRSETSRQIIALAAAVAVALLALEGARALLVRRRREPHIL